MKPFKLPARLWQTLLLILTAAAFSPLSVFAAEAGEEAYTPSVYATAWALLTSHHRDWSCADHKRSL